MRKHLAALALLPVLASPVPASAAAIITEGTFTSTEIPDNNDFKVQLTALGYDRYTSTGASIFLDEDSIIDFYFLGSESGFADTFLSGVLTLTEAFNTNNFPDGALIGSRFFAGGLVAGGEVGFTSDLGTPASLGDAGFGIFLKTGWVSGVTPVNAFIIGYDDQITSPDDDNHDDLMILAVVRSAVPEPGTWATLLFGFGALGAAMRRKSKTPRVRPTFA